jgi:helicase SWR1
MLNFMSPPSAPPADKQAQDRAHRIGQKREVNVYRLVSSHTVEENMLKKANQKRQLDDLVMQDGDFTTDFLSKIDWHDALKEFAEEALAAEPAPASADLRSAQASVWDADDPEEDEEMRALAGAAKAASHFGEDDFEGDGEASSQRHRSAGPAGEDEEDGDDGLEGVERLMVRWVEADWDYFG